MVDSKAGTVVGDYSLSELPPQRQIADLTSRPDFFTRLVKLLSLAKCRSNKVFDDTRCSIDLIVTGDPHSCSPVSVDLGGASRSTDTLRSSLECDVPVPALASFVKMDDPFEQAMPEQVARSPIIERNRNKRERKYSRRKGRPNKPPLLEPTTTLTTIPEAVPTVEPNPCLPQLGPRTEQLVTEGALMDSDSSRARAAIALARAQLEHSRPASIHRKRERAANRLMMLPGEYEEYIATQARATPVEEVATPDFSELFNADADAMRRTVQQSRSMVLSLMAAREAVLLRTDARRYTSSQAGSMPPIDSPKGSQPSFPELYKPGDTPLCPPPSIPLPQVPPPAPPASISPGRDRSRRSRASPCNSIYGGLPTEYDGNALRRVDTLIQDLLESHSEGVTSRKRSHSSASSSSRCKRINNMPDTRLDYDATCLEQWVFRSTNSADL
ncbi:hypothetical protein FRC06_011816 [Ceratobasidium sp. 370]|nr:hypothetical protein FRC06_011816 [Ceratobasidium sp. 370]